ncbi:MAG: hypothetical protein AAB336_01200 [Acidobacteriota bacterium]
MRRITLNIIVGLILVGAICFSTNVTNASQVGKTVSVNQDDLDFTLVNYTGVEIEALFVSPHTTNEWEEDVLGVNTLPSGKSVLIKFPTEEDAEYWDLRVEDDEGTYLYWRKLNLTEISVVKLYITNGKPVAVVE